MIRSELRPVDLSQPPCKVELICGPPGVGKSRYVAERAGSSDLVIDLDDIIAELSGLPLYQAGQEWVSRAINERNSRLRMLRDNTVGTAWVIVSAPGASQREWWQSHLGARLTLLMEPESVCIDRIRRDDRRKYVVDEHIAAVRRWFHIDDTGRIPVMGGCGPDGFPSDDLHPWR